MDSDMKEVEFSTGRTDMLNGLRKGDAHGGPWGKSRRDGMTRVLIEHGKVMLGIIRVCLCGQGVRKKSEEGECCLSQIWLRHRNKNTAEGTSRGTDAVGELEDGPTDDRAGYITALSAVQ